MTEHALDFLNPQYHSGMNITVRKGDKWFKKAREGDKVWITKTGRSCPETYGIIKEIDFRKFEEVTIRDLMEEHDRECNSPAGLILAMLRAYPDFTLDDGVTVIRFYIE